MRHQGLGLFLVIVGICLLEAWQGRSWLFIAGWLAFGIFVLAMDRPSPHHAPPTRQ